VVCNLHDIERICKAVPGGCRSITFIVPNDVDTLPEQFCVPNVADITLLSGKVAYRIEFDRNSARHVERHNGGNRAGDTFDSTLTFTLKKIRVEVEWLRAKLANRRVHVIAEYNGGGQRLLLNMRVLSDSDSGDRIGAPNRYNFTLTSSASAPAPFIASELTGGGGGVVMPPAPPGLTITTVINAPGGTVEIPGGSLVHAVVITPSITDNTVQIGTTSGGDELMYPDTIAAGQHYILNTAYYFPDAATIFVAASENCGIIVYLR